MNPGTVAALKRELAWISREYPYKRELICALQTLTQDQPVQPDFGQWNWTDFLPLYDRAVAEAPYGGVLVEVGCWLGRSLCYLGQSAKEANKGLRVFGIDPGFGSVGMCDEALHRPVLEESGGNTTGRLLVNLRRAGVDDVVSVIAAPSVVAADLFPTWGCSFVFIDGSHKKEDVEADIHAWKNKIAPRGRLAGHDYDRNWPSVVAAVDGFFGRSMGDDLYPNCWSWRYDT